MAQLPGQPWRIFLVSTDGGTIEASMGTDSLGAPTWSPDGRWLAHGNVECQEAETCAIHKINFLQGRNSRFRVQMGFALRAGHRMAVLSPHSIQKDMKSSCLIYLAGVAQAGRRCEWRRPELVCGLAIYLRKQAGGESAGNLTHFSERRKDGNGCRSTVLYGTDWPYQHMVCTGSRWLHYLTSRIERKRDLLPRLFGAVRFTMAVSQFDRPLALPAHDPPLSV